MKVWGDQRDDKFLKLGLDLAGEKSRDSRDPLDVDGEVSADSHLHAVVIKDLEGVLAAALHGFLHEEGLNAPFAGVLFGVPFSVVDPLEHLGLDEGLRELGDGASANQ